MYVTVILRVIESPTYQDTCLYKPHALVANSMLVRKNMIFFREVYSIFTNGGFSPANTVYRK